MAKAEDLGIIDVEVVVRDVLRLEGRITRKKQFQMLCPSPKHNDSSPSCDVDLKTGYWNCWSCDVGGDIIDLAHVVLGRPRRECRKMLKVRDVDLRSAGSRRRIQEMKASAMEQHAPRANQKLSVPAWGSYGDGPLVSLIDRGFTEETLERWGVRYSHRVVMPRMDENEEGSFFELKDVCCIPICHEDGTVGMWAYRKTERSFDWQPKELFTTKGPKQKLWSGLNLHGKAKEVAVVEGPLDAMWLDQWGIPALAVMGTHLKNEQENFWKLERLASFPKVTLFFDRDDAGASATDHLGTYLHKRGVDVRVVRYPRWVPDDADPLDLGGYDAQLLYWKATPWLRFVHARRLA